MNVNIRWHFYPIQVSTPLCRGCMNSRRSFLGLFRLQVGIKTRVDFPCIRFKDLVAILAAQLRAGINIFLSVIEVFACFRIAPPDRPDHFGTEENVVNGDDLGHELDTGLMVHAGVEKDVVEQRLQRLLPQVKRKTAIAAPMKGYSSA